MSNEIVKYQEGQFNPKLCVESTLIGERTHFLAIDEIKVPPLARMGKVTLEEVLLEGKEMPAHFYGDVPRDSPDTIPMPYLRQPLVNQLNASIEQVPESPNPQTITDISNSVTKSISQMGSVLLEGALQTGGRIAPSIELAVNLLGLKPEQMTPTPMELNRGWKIFPGVGTRLAPPSFYLITYPRNAAGEPSGLLTQPQSIESIMIPAAEKSIARLEGAQVVSLQSLIQKAPQVLSEQVLQFHALTELSNTLQKIIVNLVSHELSGQEMVANTMKELLQMDPNLRWAGMSDISVIIEGLRIINPYFSQEVHDIVALLDKREEKEGIDVSTNMYVNHLAECKGVDGEIRSQAQVLAQVLEYFTTNESEVVITYQAREEFVSGDKWQRGFVADASSYSEAVLRTIVPVTDEEVEEYTLRPQKRGEFVTKLLEGLSELEFNQLADEMKAGESDKNRRLFSIAIQLFYLNKSSLIRGNELACMGTPLFNALMSDLYPDIAPEIFAFLETKLRETKLLDQTPLLPSTEPDLEEDPKNDQQDTEES